MKRGFTILELLVASLLLGMLVSVLTMLFNQSSISWRTGVSSVEDLEVVRSKIASLRDQADNAYIWKEKTQFLLGLWDDDGELRERAWDIESSDAYNDSECPLPEMNEDFTLDKFDVVPIKNDSGGGGAFKSYIINVKSAGPNKVFDDYDDIWSALDDDIEFN